MKRLILITAALLCGCPKPTPPNTVTLQGDGFTARVTASPFSFKVTGADGVTRLETSGGPQVTFDGHTYEAQIVPGWDGYRSNERPWRNLTSGTIESSDATSATLKLTDDSGVIEVKLRTQGTRLRYEQSVDDARHFNKSSLAFVMPPNSHFFGMGQRTATLDHLGQTLYSWPEEGGLGGGEDASPSAVYFACSS